MQLAGHFRKHRGELLQDPPGDVAIGGRDLRPGDQAVGALEAEEEGREAQGREAYFGIGDGQAGSDLVAVDRGLGLAAGGARPCILARSLGTIFAPFMGVR